MSTQETSNLRLVLLNNEEYDFEGKVSATFNGKNKSSIILNGIYKLANGTERDIISFPLYSAGRLYDGNNLLFYGVVKQSTPQDISDPNQVKPAKLQLYDHMEFLTNGILLSRTFKDTKPLTIINWVIDSLGSTTNQWNFKLDTNLSFGTSDNIASWSIQDASPYDIFNDLANRTNSRFWTRGNIIFFRSWSKMIGLAVDNLTLRTMNTSIVPLKNGSALNELISMNYNDSSSFGYANAVTIRADEVVSDDSIVETFRIVGNETSFKASFNVGDVKEAWLFTPTANGSGDWTELVIRESKWTEEPYNQFYHLKYTRGENIFTYNENIDPLTAGSTLYIEYYSISSGVSVQTNELEIRRVFEQSGYVNGHISYVESKNDIHNQRDLDNYAISILDKMSTPRRDYIIKVGSSLNWAVSDIVMLDDQAYVVESINWNHLYIKNNFNLYEFTYNLTNTKNDTQTVNFYDKRFETTDDPTSVREQIVSADLEIVFNNPKSITSSTSYPDIDDLAMTNLSLLNTKNEELVSYSLANVSTARAIELEIDLNGK